MKFQTVITKDLAENKNTSNNKDTKIEIKTLQERRIAKKHKLGTICYNLVRSRYG